MRPAGLSMAVGQLHNLVFSDGYNWGGVLEKIRENEGKDDYRLKDCGFP